VVNKYRNMATMKTINLPWHAGDIESTLELLPEIAAALCQERCRRKALDQSDPLF
jgi:hypothetical protein